MMNKRELADTVSGEIVGELINLAGRQRMLSQRIVLHVLLSVRGESGALAVARTCLATFAQAHAQLVDGNDHLPGAFSEALHGLYFGSHRADERIRGFMRVATDAIEALERNSEPVCAPRDAVIGRLTAEASPLLDLLQAITQAYQDEMQSVEEAARRRQMGVVHELAAISMRANIVAMNGRVAAARAGQFGREFAVITAELAHVIGEMDNLVQSVVGARRGVDGNERGAALRAGRINRATSQRMNSHHTG
ncbi:type IV pili methyl-accepting chemotaxis transducer N-terminal domain-containing protein (plasmid) [Paraburkholderia sprentiae WSM5005]|uniref:Type IV pili methyl-accepting chemotaxis transducer N-terminal domain-containing protein n=1 Tax=Paraburkholderia sprentiae WSM5005 TaxID=754502 RepID=A0A1I9YST5_9BURK|nr:type IV pili methyl-accepting chemotaxis transducer N-terminal domain-containing protein [Paraburkholderia sprentiae]APA89961.1 type IV pili methyl-accepting chemotaxis transducer N-terminal domain-containing protein [Paraburkholderia sprentiae WSM5005]